MFLSSAFFFIIAQGRERIRRDGCKNIVKKTRTGKVYFLLDKGRRIS
jgi:hypothetical protein